MMVEYLCFECDHDDPCVLFMEIEPDAEPMLCPFVGNTEPVWVKQEEEDE